MQIFGLFFIAFKPKLMNAWEILDEKQLKCSLNSKVTKSATIYNNFILILENQIKNNQISSSLPIASNAIPNESQNLTALTSIQSIQSRILAAAHVLNQSQFKVDFIKTRYHFYHVWWSS